MVDGGGQGNHWGGAYSSQILSAMGSRYIYSALAQEKTGDIWLNGRLFGSQICHTTEDVEHADYVLSWHKSFYGTWNCKCKRHPESLTKRPQQNNGCY